MRITVLSVGRWQRGPERELFERYVKRCPWSVELVELSLKKPVATAELRQAESRLLGAALDPRRPVVLLDESGHLATSEEIAAMLGQYRDAGRGGVTIVIGGAGGVDDTLRARAEVSLALGRCTWPHLLVRALLAEQLYRAASILAGHPYHRGAPGA